MSTKKKTTTTQATQQANTLPDWLLSPYQSALGTATNLASQPAIGANTSAALGNIRNSANQASALGSQAAGALSGIASGNFGQPALTGAANGSFLASNPFAQNGQPTNVSGALNGYAANGQPTSISDALNGYTANGKPIGVSSALSGFTGNGGLDTGYINQSGLNDTASGKYLTADSNPYIRGVAQQGADSAQSAINSQFGAAGRSNGSGLYAQLFGQGISDATNSVYAQNYANERQLQQGAQNTLLSTNQSAREAALARQYGASSNVFGAENSANENAAGRQYGASTNIFGAQNSANENAANRQYGASTNIFGAQNSSAENAASRQASAYEAERQRQQAAAGGLLNTQLSASSQLPSLLSAIASGNNQALAAGQYEDNADLSRQQQYISLLSQLAAPYGMSSGTSNGTQTEKTGGLGTTLGTIAQLGGAAASLYGGGGLSGLAGLGGATSSALGGINSGLNLQALGLSGWR